MIPEHVERSFLDPEYSFDEYFQLGSWRKVGPIKNQLASPNTSNLVREETFAQLRTGLKRHERKEERLWIQWQSVSRDVGPPGNRDRLPTSQHLCWLVSAGVHSRHALSSLRRNVKPFEMTDKALTASANDKTHR